MRCAYSREERKIKDTRISVSRKAKIYLFLSLSWVATKSLLGLNANWLSTERKHMQKRKSEKDTWIYLGGSQKIKFLKKYFDEKKMTKNDS